MAKQAGRYSPEIERLQREAASDGFPISIDGKDGPETKAALEQYRRSKAEKQRQDAERNQANAAAQKAASEAEAKRAEAETERVRQETEGKRIEAEAKKRADEAAEKQRERDAAARKQIKDTAALTAAIAAGITLGHKSAASIDKKDKAARAALSKEVGKSGKIVDQALDTIAKPRASKAAVATSEARIRGAVAAVDKLDPKGTPRTLKTLGRLGVLRGASFIAEGVALRTVVADGVQNEDGKLLIQEAGTALMLAGSGTIAEQATSIATQAPVNAKGLSQVEAGRAFTEAKDAGATSKAAAKQAIKVTADASKAAAATEAASGMAKAVKSIARKVLPWAGIVAGTVAVAKAAKAEGVSGALKTAAERVDPTNGAAARLVSAGGEEQSPLKELARQQALERQKKTGVAEIAQQFTGEGPGQQKQPMGPDVDLPKTSDIARGMVERGTMDPRQAALMAAVGAQGLDNYYAGFRPPEMLARERHQEAAAEATREATGREVVMSSPALIEQASHAAVTAERRPHHVWDDNARAAAAEARRQKRGY